MKWPVRASLLGVSLGIGGWSLALPKGGDAVDAYQDGLAAFRKPGKTPDAAACASCHAPDGIDLAAFSFDDGAIRRRAKVHLNSADTERVVTFIHAVRERYRISAPRDSMTDRPFQPGGATLPGATPALRDEAFGRQLASKLPTLMGQPIRTSSEAIKAEKELLALDPWTLQVGFPFNRISEDAFHGKEHATIAQWFPERSPEVAADNRGAWNKRVDEYLASPSKKTLRALVAGHYQMVKYPGNALQRIANAKYEALLVFQHQLRQELTGKKSVRGILAPEIAPWPASNPFWEVGNTARDFRGLDAQHLGIDDTMLSDKLTGPSMEIQLADLRLPWMWLGWLSDQGQYRTGGENEIRRGDWLAEAISQDGPYPIHNLYSTARRQLVVSRYPQSWTGDPKRQHLFWDYAAVRMEGRFLNDMPKSGEHRRLYSRFAANCIRMSLWQVRAEMKKTGRVWLKLNAYQNVRELTGLLNVLEPTEKASSLQMKNEMFRSISAAKDQQ